MERKWHAAACSAVLLAFPIVASPATAQQTVLNAIREAETSLSECYRSKALALDDGSDIAIILKATETACAPDYGRFKAAWARLPFYPALYAESQVIDGVARARKGAELAIANARASRKIPLR